VLLRQALLNLLSNALKYTRTRPVAIIEIGRRTNAREAVVFIKDNGVGFDPRPLARRRPGPERGAPPGM
jgi:signal transduction histidine kinase